MKEILQNSLPIWQSRESYVDEVVQKGLRILGADNSYSQEGALRERAEKLYDELAILRRGAALVDTIDKPIGALNLAKTIPSVKATLAKAPYKKYLLAAEIGELLGKAAFAGIYLVRSPEILEDKLNTLGIWGLAEAARIFPWVGSAADVADLYSNKVKYLLAEEAVKKLPAGTPA